MNEYEKLNNEQLDWDAVIEQDSEFTILPEGDYDFEVKSFEREFFNGSASGKVPPCKMAVLQLKITGDAGSTTITERLYLLTKFEWKLSAFFRSIGEKKHGEKVKMNWNNVVGAKGRCHVYVDRYNDKDYNKIRSYLDPESQASSKYGSF